MGLLGLILMVTGGLLCLAFMIRVVIESWKIIYAIAPYIIMIILLFLLSVGFSNLEQEMETQDANHIESIEYPSRRSER